jgi:hypothetical protein
MLPVCQVHLVPEIDELRVAAEPFKCGECRRKVKAGKPYRHIEGPLDDGSPERWVYKAHDDCYQLCVSDVGEDGCFHYGEAQPL